MKVLPIKTKEPIAKFKPTAIEITFETEEEMYEFFVFFNYCPITDVLKHINSHEIRQAIESAYIQAENKTNFNYAKHFDVLQKEFKFVNN